MDFITPIVDDPYDFGQIAAANSLSDVYVMGGTPITALNIICFPASSCNIDELKQILQGGADKVAEAGAVLSGGHSVLDDEPKYGLSVTGFIHPDRILTKKNLKAGDRLVLTKPLGTGIINTAVKGGLASDEAIKFVTLLMAALNKDAAEIMQACPVHACTDITGFGLIGHLAEMVIDSGLGVEILSDRLPVIPEALEYAGMGLVPAGAYKNREFREAMVDIGPSVDSIVQDILFDPQTSGGLLICVEDQSAAELVSSLKQKGMLYTSIIGKAVSGPQEKIIIR